MSNTKSKTDDKATKDDDKATKDDDKATKDDGKGSGKSGEVTAKTTAPLPAMPYGVPIRAGSLLKKEGKKIRDAPKDQKATAVDREALAEELAKLLTEGDPAGSWSVTFKAE